MKIPFINKIKHAARTGLAASILYASSSLPFTYSQEKDNPLKEITIPEKLTQQTEDFYKTPEKEFIFYKTAYTEAIGDGVIDSKDVEQLEGILRRTLEEMQKKVYDKGEIKFLSLPDIAAYRDLYRKRFEDLKELQKHLELKKEWLASDACQGKFWNYGTGLFMYWDASDNGNITLTGHPSLFNEGYKGLEAVFKDNFYKENLPTLKNIGNFNISEPCEEFPAKTKMNYWLGLALGTTLPCLSFAVLVALRERRMKKRIELNSGEENFLAGHTLLNPIVGYILLDSLHPLMYPARLIIPPLIYSCVVMNSKPAPASASSSPSASSPAGSPSASSPAGSPKLTRPTSPSKLEEKIKDIPNPWDIDIPKIEDKKISTE